jgi:hypothetical protein
MTAPIQPSPAALAIYRKRDAWCERTGGEARWCWITSSCFHAELWLHGKIVVAVEASHPWLAWAECLDDAWEVE